MPSQSQRSPDPVSPSPDQRRLGEANLAFFMRDRVAHVLTRINSMETLTPRQGSFTNAELLESFLWLHHGVIIEYFPLPISRRVVYEYLPLFLKAYESLRRESYFETWFTPPLRTIFESEFTGNQELFSFGRIWEPSNTPAGTDELFQLPLVLANGLVQNLDARTLMEAVATAGESAWQDVILKNPAAFEQSDPDDHSSRWTHSGFFAVLGFMRAFRALKLDLEQRHLDKDQQHYLRLLKETQQWRLNLGYPEYRERFLQICRAAAETYIKQLPPEESPWTAVADFVRSFQELMTDWGAPLVMGAGA